MQGSEPPCTSAGSWWAQISDQSSQRPKRLTSKARGAPDATQCLGAWIKVGTTRASRRRESEREACARCVVSHGPCRSRQHFCAKRDQSFCHLVDRLAVKLNTDTERLIQSRHGGNHHIQAERPCIVVERPHGS